MKEEEKDEDTKTEWKEYHKLTQNPKQAVKQFSITSNNINPRKKKDKGRKTDDKKR